MNPSLAMVGHFSGLEARKPDRNPGRTTPCPLCGDELGAGPLTTISFQRDNDVRSYFYRAHGPCWDQAGAAGQDALTDDFLRLLDAGQPTALRRPA